MRKPKPIQIIIPDPCKQDWQKMKPEGIGRHCSQCDKTIIDFSCFSDADLYKFLTDPQNINVCGRFGTSQLNRDIIANIQTHKNLFRHAAALGALFLVLASGLQGFARAPITHHNVIDAIDSTPDSTDSKAPEICGVVMDNTNEPLIGAVVLLVRKGVTISGASTDEFGRFSLILPDDGIFDLEVRYVGFKGMTIENVNTKTNLNNIVLSFNTEADFIEMTMGILTPLVDCKK